MVRTPSSPISCFCITSNKSDTFLLLEQKSNWKRFLLEELDNPRYCYIFQYEIIQNSVERPCLDTPCNWLFIFHKATRLFFAGIYLNINVQRFQLCVLRVYEKITHLHWEYSCTLLDSPGFVFCKYQERYYGLESP